MSPPLGPKVKNFVKTNPFKRAEAKLDSSTKIELKKLYREMERGDYSNGRHVKVRKGTRKNRPKEWQARLDQNNRITFNYKKGTATLLLVGPHHLFD